MSVRWREASDCSHSNDDVCRACDFDSYYALTNDSCPWRAERLAGLVDADATLIGGA